MLANRTIRVSDGPQWAEHICTGWRGFDDDQRMLCTVSQALVRLSRSGITRGVLAIIELDSWVEMRTDLGQPDLGAGKVRGLRHGKLVVQWRHRPAGEVSHHLVRFVEPPTS